jgi:hypothetical protein
MKICGNFQNLEMCGIHQWSYSSQCRAPEKGVLGRKVSIDACLRVWKHEMHCNNENWFGIFFYLPYFGVPFGHLGAPGIIFNDTGVIYSVHIILL